MYHAGNARRTMYGDCWRLRLLAFCGWALGIQFHVQGLPFGAAYDRKRAEAFHGPSESGCQGKAA